MIYSDVKLLLEGYTEYLSFTIGTDFRLKWIKNFKQFELLVKNPEEDNVVYDYKMIIAFEMGYINTDCIIRINNFQDYGMFLDMIVRLEDKVIFRDFVDLIEIEVKAKTKEQIRAVLDILEEINYFGRWR